jgi:hypothetical protein
MARQWVLVVPLFPLAVSPPCNLAGQAGLFPYGGRGELAHAGLRCRNIVWFVSTVQDVTPHV